MHLPSSNWTVALAALPLLALAASCAEDGGDDDNDVVCAGAKCDAPTDPTQFACQNVVDESGRGRPNVLAELQDPVSVFVLRGGSGCPRTYKETVAKLRTEDKVGCDAGGGAGMASHFVTETGQLDSGALLQSFRTVTSRRCNSRQEWELLFSLFGVPASGQLPNNAEVIAFDPESKEFNYYEVDSGKWHFFGSSSDFVEGRGGRCANCHTGGGLIMKELDVPWVHWTGHFATPGTTRVIDANKDDLGRESSGANMEGLTNSGNREWTKTRVTNALNPARGDVQALLRPLFCTVEANLDNAADFDSSPVDSLPADFFVDPLLKAFGSVGMTDEIYVAARTAAGSQVPGLAGQADTIFKFTFVERSKSDKMYVDELKSRGVLDDDFITDVLMVDFTRPIFSDARCSLLQFAPTFEQLEGPAPTTGGDTDPTDGTDTDPTDGESGTSDATDPSAGETADPTGDTAGTGSGDCCTEAADRTGCENDTIEMCVCAEDGFCCDNSWDETCVGIANDSCNAMCGAGIADGDGLSLQAEPEVSAAVAAADIRAHFIANIQASNPAAGSAAAQLLANLQAVGDTQTHKASVDAFLKACEDRDERALMDDAFKIQTWQRGIAFGMPMFEFPQTMPETNLQVSATAHWDAATCTVVD
jgi:hypothetical protein